MIESMSLLFYLPYRWGLWGSPCSLEAGLSPRHLVQGSTELPQCTGETDAAKERLEVRRLASHREQFLLWECEITYWVCSLQFHRVGEDNERTEEPATSPKGKYKWMSEWEIERSYLFFPFPMYGTHHCQHPCLLSISNHRVPKLSSSIAWSDGLQLCHIHLAPPTWWTCLY